MVPLVKPLSNKNLARVSFHALELILVHKVPYPISRHDLDVLDQLTLEVV